MPEENILLNFFKRRLQVVTIYTQKIICLPYTIEAVPFLNLIIICEKGRLHLSTDYD